MVKSMLNRIADPCLRSFLRQDFGRPLRLAQQTPHRVPQQVNVGRVNARRFRPRTSQNRPRSGSPGFFSTTLCPLSTTSCSTADNNSGVNKDTLSTTVWYS